MARQDQFGNFLPSKEQLRLAEERLIAKTGFSREELTEQAEEGRFKSPLAERAWYLLS